MIWKFGERLEELELERYKSWQKKTFFERDIQYILYSHWSNRLDELAEKLDKKLNCLSFNSLYLHWFDLICLNQKLEDKRGGWDEFGFGIFFFFIDWILYYKIISIINLDLIWFYFDNPKEIYLQFKKEARGEKLFFVCMFVCFLPLSCCLLLLWVRRCCFSFPTLGGGKKFFFFFFPFSASFDSSFSNQPTTPFKFHLNQIQWLE